MEIGYDPDKNARNIRERGLPFADVALLDWSTAIVREDTRTDYGETRLQALVTGPDGRPYVVVYAERDTTMWVISFRRAHDRERRSYEKKT